MNRASPKVQSAFLEVMQDGKVSIEGETLSLGKPFMVIATQLPYGELGTYPLTSVQIDRFAFRVMVENPETKDELEIVRRIDEIESAQIEPVLSQIDIRDLEKQAKLVHISEEVEKYIVDLVQGLRRNPDVRIGPSPRASIWLKRGARVKALIDGRDFVIPDDVKALAGSVIEHRMELTPQARAEDVAVSTLIAEVLGSTPVPKGI